MLTATLLAHFLSLPATATACYNATVYLETVHAVQVERHARVDRLGSWLDQLDGERIRAASIYSPFADDAQDSADPFEAGK